MDIMKNLRAKLWLGFGGLLALLVVVSALSLGVINWYSHAIERVLSENYRSVVYGEKMLDALDRLTADAQDVTFAGGARDDRFENRLALAKGQFRENLEREHGNITLPGEGRAEGLLRKDWTSYQSRLDGVLAPGIGDTERRGQYGDVLKARDAVKTATQKIIDMNLENMVTVNGHAREWAGWSETAVYLILGCGLILGTLLMALVGRWILRPLGTLTRSVREIEAGNLNLVVPVKSRDEVGQLAEAFNSMAAKLRAFRQTDQAKLLRTQQTTQLAIDSLPDAVAVINPDGVLEITNGAATRLFHLKPGNAVSALKMEWLTNLFSAVRDQQRAYEPQGYQNALQVFDGGTEKFFLPQGVPIRDAEGGGRLVGVTVVLIDVTRLRQIDEIKSSLVSTVSHELRTPLTGIRLANHLLLSDRIGALSAKQTEVVMESRDNADRLQRIIENLLDMSRIEAGTGVLELAPIAPHELAKEAADQVRSAAQEKGIDLQVNVPVELPRVRADRTRVVHVLLNLLNNAVRYTPAGGRITVAAAPAEDGMVEFSVRDTGQGISKAYEGRVFERFFRVPGQTSNGVGLGLAIAREIIQAHGGAIQVQSQEGEGTTFRFTLARDQAGG
jgi:signal transduction histidine kinase/HAMP domain-containing protein